MLELLEWNRVLRESYVVIFVLNNRRILYLDLINIMDIF